MTTLEKFQQEANINFITTPSHADFELGTMCTVDGYELFYITQDIQNLQFDSEVFYYRPEFDTIMDYISKRSSVNYNSLVNVMCYDIEDWFDEYYMLDYLESNMDEEAFDEFTNDIKI